MLYPIQCCKVGFDLVQGSTSATGSQGVGAEAIIDAVVSNTPIFVRTSGPSNGHLQGSVVLNNIKLTNVGIAVGVKGGATVVSTIYSHCKDISSLIFGISSTVVASQSTPGPKAMSTMVPDKTRLSLRAILHLSLRPQACLMALVGS